MKAKEKVLTDRQRNNALDYVRGFAAILVIFGHMTTYPREIRTYIYSFHMPLFFILSGITFDGSKKTMTFKELIQKKTNSILIPALFFEVLMYLWFVVKNFMEPEYSVAQLGKRFLGIFLQIGYSDYAGSLWFFPVIFLAILGVYWIRRCGSWIIQLIISCICLATSYCFTYFNENVFLIWHLEIVPLAIFYIMVGIAIANILNQMEQHCLWYHFLLSGMIFIIIWFVIQTVTGNSFTFDSHSYGNILINVICAVTASFGLICVCYAIKDIWLPHLAYIGRYSMVYYGVHGVMVGILNTILWHFFSDLYNWKGLLLSILSLLCSLIFDTIFVAFYQRYISPRLPKIGLKST